MESNSRPVIIASLGYDDKGPCFINETTRVRIPEAQLIPVLRVLGDARGYRTIGELAEANGMDTASLLELFSSLEKLGVCLEAHQRSLYGHRASRYPDPLRQSAPEEVIVNQLMRLPPDPGGKFFAARPVANPGDPLLTRRTSLSFSARPLAFEELSHLAFAAYGTTREGANWTSRTVPSAGAMYPLEISYIVLNAELRTGLYRWAKHENGFIFQRPVDQAELEDAFSLAQPTWQQAAVIQVIAFDVGRSAEKYSARAYKFAMVEAGHAAMNAMNMATQRGVGSWEYGGYLDEKLEEIVGMNSPTGGIATMVFYGHVD